MTTQLHTFLKELADLMERHGVEIEAAEESGRLDLYCAGIDIETQNGDCVRVDKYIRPHDLRKEAEDMEKQLQDQPCDK